jgi:arylsulfatase A-like enzyme
LAGGKSQLYEGGIRVPFIARGPGIAGGAVCREAVTGCDLLPTFCELAGVSSPEKVEGTSLVPLLADRPGSFQRKEASLVFHYPHYGHGREVPQSAILVGDLKLLRFYETAQCRLFDLSKDIGERRDLSKEMPDKAREMERLLDAYLKRVGAQMPTPNAEYDPSANDTRRSRGKAGGRSSEGARAETLRGPAARRDTNGDGKISRTEAPPHLRSIFDQADTNGDGFLDADELRKHRGGRGR